MLHKPGWSSLSSSLVQLAGPKGRTQELSVLAGDPGTVPVRAGDMSVGGKEEGPSCWHQLPAPGALRGSEQQKVIHWRGKKPPSRQCFS